MIVYDRLWSFMIVYDRLWSFMIVYEFGADGL